MAFLVLVNLLIKPFWIFGIELKVQNLLGAAVYGRNYFALYNFVVLFMVVLDLGINNFNNRAISQNPEKLAINFSRFLSLKLFIAFIYVLLLLGIGKAIGYNAFQLKLLVWLMAAQILLSFVQFFRSNLGALQWFKKDSFISILDKSLMILFCVVLLWGGLVQFNIWHFVQAQTLAYLLAAIGAFILLRKQVVPLKFKLQPDKIISLLKQTYPYALITLLMSFYNRLDGVMLERLLADDGYQAGVYAAGYRLLDAFNQVGLLSGTILLPVFAKMIKNNEKVIRLASIFGVIALTGASILAIGCWGYRFEIMDWLYIESTIEYGQTFGILMFSFIGIASMYIFGTLLLANGSLKMLNWIALGGLLLNFGLNFHLIPSIGSYGAALSTLLTQSLVAIAQILTIVFIFYKKP